MRDNAAAQYGSDAIAGVIDLHLRQDAGFSGEATVGQFYNHDGATVSASGNYGVKLDKGGFVNLTATFRDSNYTDRSGPDLRQQLTSARRARRPACRSLPAPRSGPSTARPTRVTPS